MACFVTAIRRALTERLITNRTTLKTFERFSPFADSDNEDFSICHNMPTLIEWNRIPLFYFGQSVLAGKNQAWFHSTTLQPSKSETSDEIVVENVCKPTI